MLAADAQLDVRTSSRTFLDGNFHQLAHPLLIQCLERIRRKDVQLLVLVDVTPVVIATYAATTNRGAWFPTFGGIPDNHLHQRRDCRALNG